MEEQAVDQGHREKRRRCLRFRPVGWKHPSFLGIGPELEGGNLHKTFVYGAAVEIKTRPRHDGYESLAHLRHIKTKGL